MRQNRSCAQEMVTLKESRNLFGPMPESLGEALCPILCPLPIENHRKQWQSGNRENHLYWRGKSIR